MFGKTDVFCFAADALIKLAKKDPSCIPLRLFFERQTHVVTTRECFDEARREFIRDTNDRVRAEAFFSAYFDKVEIVSTNGLQAQVRTLREKYSLEEPEASLLAAMKSSPQIPEVQKGTYYLVTEDARLMSAAEKESLSFHNYTEEEFCSRYGG